MSVSAAITVNQILTRVAVEAGLSADTDPFGSPREEYVQLRTLLQTACEDLCLAHPWEFLTRTLSITTTSERAYPLPADFLNLVDETGWNMSTDEPIYLISPTQWRAIEAGDIDPVAYGFRIMGGKIVFIQKILPVGIELRFEYISRNFVVPAADPTTTADSFAEGADTVLYDRTLITRYLKSLWFEAKGFDSTTAQSAFAQIFDMLIGKDKGGATLSAGGARQYRLLDNRNVPDHGYGL